MRERECLRLVRDHHSSKEIARLLGVSITSVDTYVRRALFKLGVNDRFVAAKLFDQWERGPAVAQPSLSAPSVPVLAGVGERGWRLPPLAELNLAQRLVLILVGAVIGAVAFGALLTALAAL
ncbi:MAG TPA: helix-turn-helix transcriptional regulator [Caulobacteraceae bacterium]